MFLRPILHRRIDAWRKAMSEEQFKKLRHFLFPNLSPTAKITEAMIDKRLKALVDQPARVGNKVLVLRTREENGRTVYWIEKGETQ